MFEFICFCAYAFIISIVFYPMYLGVKEEIDRNKRLYNIRKRNK